MVRMELVVSVFVLAVVTAIVMGTRVSTGPVAIVAIERQAVTLLR